MLHGQGRASARLSCSPEAARSVSPSQGHADDNVSEEEGAAEEEEEEGDLRRSSTRSDTCSSASERVLSEADLTRLSLRSPSSLDAEPPATLQLRKINLSGFSLQTPRGSIHDLQANAPPRLSRRLWTSRRACGERPRKLSWLQPPLWARR